ncbi:glycoside hydrolase family 132 protein [Pleomassaria siparia CBS 279.74]|uniref:Glycoside hydrolase family 132 protein n=1 Tax=Pleomassaria siparia CBS 279.74 TaxID=1314801 RepID=A0A6G1KBW0_9PLEO|nr:glycoside hydrolase family 132 protein [Pleomassaria siparia CBS 279.74]
MKLLLVVTLAAVTVPILAQPHHHAHAHLRRSVNKREAAVATVYYPGPVQTVVVYELDGHPISEEDVRQGIQNGTLVWGNDGILSSSIAMPVATAPPGPVTIQEPEPTQATPAPEETSSVAPAPNQPEPEPEPSSAPLPSPSQPDDHHGDCADCDKEFPNNKYFCDSFPLGYGAIPLINEGLGGWSGIQDPQHRQSDGFDEIVTVPKGSCADGTCCSPGTFCSYGCPNPYLKMSFPKMQGRTKQSVGGLYCNENGKLQMAEGSLGKTLCGKGSEHMVVKVRNDLPDPVSICRTDYPGTESMTIPLTVSPGETAELANPNQGGYYFWDDKPTSAQYYINNKGVPEKDACTWGSSDKTAGNWAPLNFGTSWDDINMNMGFPSLAPNNPTTDAKLDFTVTFTGDGIQNACRYNGHTKKFCQGPANDYSQCDNAAGCTAAVKAGNTLTLVFTE